MSKWFQEFRHNLYSFLNFILLMNGSKICLRRGFTPKYAEYTSDDDDNEQENVKNNENKNVVRAGHFNTPASD